MKKSVKKKSSTETVLPEVVVPEAAAPQADIAGLINKVQQQLVYLEKKIDTLISQSQEKKFEPKTFEQKSFQPKSFQKPFQRYDRPRHEGHVRQDNNAFGPRPMHKAVCADCNNECEVPFKPTGDRPVYCKECFGKRKAPGTFKDNDRGAFGRDRHDNKPRHEEPHKERFFEKFVGGKNRKSPARSKSAVRKRKK
jgi:CxxC-x17-CxxC domain-containing protein